MSPAPAPDPAAVAAILEVAEEEGAPRAWLRIYGQETARRVIQKLRQGGWQLARAPNPPPGEGIPCLVCSRAVLAGSPGSGVLCAACVARGPE